MAIFFTLPRKQLLLCQNCSHMNHLAIITEPIAAELEAYDSLYRQALTHSQSPQRELLAHLQASSGKRMRPILTLLIAKAFGMVTTATLHTAVGLELLHAASLTHDDVVDESPQRRGQPSLNAVYDNKLAVLTGDYILSTALLHIAKSENTDIVSLTAKLGQTLAEGEILQLHAAATTTDEDTYYKIIHSKTAALFATCCETALISAMKPAAEQQTNSVQEQQTALPHPTAEQLAAVRQFGQTIGTIFQIRDDIFDYFNDQSIGKPTAHDLREGKLTLPAIYALRKAQEAVEGNNDSCKDNNNITKAQHQEILQAAQRIKQHTATEQDIIALTQHSIAMGGIDYARQQIERLRLSAQRFIDNNVTDIFLHKSLTTYLEYVMERDN